MSAVRRPSIPSVATPHHSQNLSEPMNRQSVTQSRLVPASVRAVAYRHAGTVVLLPASYLGLANDAAWHHARLMTHHHLLTDRRHDG